MRAFVGLPVPEDWIAPLMRAEARLPGGRGVDADDLHVTLAFAPFGSRPNLVALDLAPDPGLGALRDAVRAAARTAGIALPRERFRPHVTLKRFPRAHPPPPRLGEALAGLGAPGMGPAAARLVTLWSSTLTPAGPLYDPLASYPVAAGAA